MVAQQFVSNVVEDIKWSLHKACIITDSELDNKTKQHPKEMGK